MLDIELVPTQKDLDLGLNPFEEILEKIDDIFLNKFTSDANRDKCRELYKIIEGDS